MRKRLTALGILLPLVLLSGCYSFRGTSISPEVQTYFVKTFVNNVADAPARLPIQLTEALKDKVRLNSRLELREQEPDLIFEGTLVDYRITAEAPTANQTVAINRLTINVAVDYINEVNEDQGFSRNFSFFFDFPASTSFASVEEEATETIINQLMEDIFNAAFSNW